MSDFITLFTAVFLATVMGKIAGELYDRYLKDIVEQTLDNAEDHIEKAIKDLK